MLEAVSPRIIVSIASEIRKNEQRCSSGIFRLTLDDFPHLSTETVGAANPINVERVRSRMRDIDIVHRDPKKARSDLANYLPRDVQRQFIRLPRCARMSFTV